MKIFCEKRIQMKCKIDVLQKIFCQIEISPHEFIIFQHHSFIIFIKIIKRVKLIKISTSHSKLKLNCVYKKTELKIVRFEKLGLFYLYNITIFSAINSEMFSHFAYQERCR